MTQSCEFLPCRTAGYDISNCIAVLTCCPPDIDLMTSSPTRTLAVRIPLDLYQILGVPIQATPEQIQQAFVDRQQQLPRQQYTEAAIKTRNQLLEQAYAVLAVEELRAAYDHNILAEGGPSAGTVDADAAPIESGMELDERQLVGALLLLQDVGEYSTILELGEAYLNRSIDLNQLPTQAPVSEEDVVLTMALAHLESGRELWQQQQFESASGALLKGRDLLSREQCLPELQQEIQTDLDKLRPYQVLERLSLPVDDPERQQGLFLLQEMLEQRGGIDGRRDDQSGLGIDDFLRFVQQLRSHLTVAEQQELFEKEAQRPSAVASYLASYALVAGGFSEGQPAKIQQAHTRLSQLANRQDTYVEQAMCSLLLGHPNIATQTLPLSQDEESLAFIRQYSEGAEDEIPGLFLYTEHWLQQEVYPYFRDLVEQPVLLQGYFNDKKIQAALCALEPNVERQAPGSATVRLPGPGPSGQKTSPPQQATVPTTPTELQTLQSLNIREIQPPDIQAAPVAAAPIVPGPQPTFPTGGNAEVSSGTRTTGSVTAAVPAVRQKSQTRPVKHPLGGGRGQRQGWLPWAGALLLGLVAVGGIVALMSRPKPAVTGSSDSAPSVPEVQTDAPEIGVGGSTTLDPVASPSPDLSELEASGPLSLEGARQMIESWQSIKAEAKGEGHQIDKLSQSLVDPMLSEWTQKAQQEKARSAHWQYQLDNLKVEKVEPQGEEQASIYVQLKETAKIVSQGQVEYSYQEPYRAKYDVVRQNNKWRIKNVKVLP
jgi:curved DNA-binding protein CbpA